VGSAIVSSKFRLQKHYTDFSYTKSRTIRKPKVLSIVSVKQSNPCEVEVSAHEMQAGEHIHIALISGTVELNNTYASITPIGDSRIQLNGVDATGYSAYASGGQVERVLVAGASGVPIKRFYVDTSSDHVVLQQNAVSANIGGISKAAQAIVSTSAVTHGASIGDTLFFSAVFGMTEINGKRGEVVSVISPSALVVDINTSSFSVHTGGGIARSAIASTEKITAGFEFRVPVRYDTDKLSQRMEAYEIGEIIVPLIEVKDE
jgi:hypothetical protein